ncbi:putative cysteine peptidase [Mycoplasmopsis hyopharyngis]|uniref:putative cysteine peptidase n=1 Tax=Mycoplasmopsis hyopharyngis TaxID=29558 RepID=UPI003872DF53
MNKILFITIPIISITSLSYVSASFNFEHTKNKIYIDEFLTFVEKEANSYFKNRKFFVDQYSIKENTLHIYFKNRGFMKISLEDLNVLEFNPNWNNNKEILKEKNDNFSLKPSNLLSHNFSIKKNKLNFENFDLWSKHKINEELNTYKQLEITSNINNLENNEEFFLNAQYEISYSWWFKSNFALFGYTDVDTSNEDEEFEENIPISIRSIFKEKAGDKGLCEYVALSLLFQYYQLFKNSNFFSSQMMDEYSTIYNPNKNKYEYYEKEIEYEIEKNLNFLKNKNLPISPLFSRKLAADLWRGADKTINIIHPSWYTKAWKSIFKNPMITNYWYHTYAFNRPWIPLYNDKPVIMGGYVSSLKNDVESAYHAVVAYGKWYNENKNGLKKDKYLVHYGWPSSTNIYSQVVIDAKHIRNWGYMYYIDDKSTKKQKELKKYFYFKNGFVSADQLEAKIDLNKEM